MHATRQPPTEQISDDVLVVLDEASPERTVRAAVQHWNPAKTTFHLLMVVPTQRYEDQRRSMADAGLARNYTIGQAKENARQTATRVGRAYLGPGNDGFCATGAVGRRRDQVRALVEERDISTVLLPDDDRSVIQRVLSGGSSAHHLARALPDGIAVETVDAGRVPSRSSRSSESTVDTGGP